MRFAAPSAAVASVLAVLNVSGARAGPCADDTEEYFAIEPDGYESWCEGPDGPTSPRRRHDALGRWIRPPPSEVPAGTEARLGPRLVDTRPRARPFAFSNLGPGGGQFVAAIGLRSFPTELPLPALGLDLMWVYAPFERLKLELRASSLVLANTIDLSVSPLRLGGPTVSIAPRLGLGAFAGLGQDWTARVGPRAGLALSFGNDTTQVTAAAELLSLLEFRRGTAPETSVQALGARVQLAAEFAFDAPAEREPSASLYVELTAEAPGLAEFGEPAYPRVSVSLGAVL